MLGISSDWWRVGSADRLVDWSVDWSVEWSVDWREDWREDWRAARLFGKRLLLKRIDWTATDWRAV